jgi:type II secretion system protein N
MNGCRHLKVNVLNSKKDSSVKGMARRPSKYRKYFGYILFSILLVIALLYYRFPTDALKNYLQATADDMDANYHVSIGNARPAFPFGVRLLDTVVVPRNDSETNVFAADTLLIRPEIISFIRGRLKYDFDCLAYNGDLKGFVHFKKRGMNGPFITMIELKGIHMADYEYLSTLIGRDVKGILSGTINYRGQQDVLINGNGEANLTVSDGWVQLLEPLFGLESVDFDDLRIKMVLDKRKIQLNNVELEGRNLKGTLSGTVSLKRDLSRSSLALKGSIEPSAAFFGGEKGASNTLKRLTRGLKKGKISFVIRGTPKNPRIRFT